MTKKFMVADVVEPFGVVVDEAGLKRKAKTQLRLNKLNGFDLEVKSKDLDRTINAQTFLMNSGATVRRVK